MSDHEIQRYEQEGGLPTAGGASDILRIAVEKNIDPASIQKLAELVWKQEDRRAAQEFGEALREFSKRVPPITKSKAVRDKHGKALYHYAPLQVIDPIVRPICADLGLFYSWDGVTKDGMRTTTCILRHVNGHKETASFSCPTSGGTSMMSGAQKEKGADSFARRVTLTSVLGLTELDPDADGADPTTISDEQSAQIEDMLSALDADRDKFLVWAKVESIGDIRARDFARTMKALQIKASR